MSPAGRKLIVLAQSWWLMWACSSHILPCQPRGEELCNGFDDDCDGKLDEGFAVGEACDGDDTDVCPNGTFTCTADGRGVECVNEDPAGLVEICNQQDDDCDGESDEELAACACSGGGEPRSESCNAVDDDCDGQIDEGLSACACTGGGSPGQERCNGIDDDCDGTADEGFAVGQACDGTDADECLNGTFTCTADGLGVECNNENPAGLVESCNNLDDDCDGESDEELAACACTYGPPAEERCNAIDDDCDGQIDNLSACACSGGGEPTEEVCNAIDDDCDGQIDNLPACACTGGASPAREICDGVDNDCDQHIDEDNGAGGACHGFGEPCSSSVDCSSQLCAGDNFERYCSRECELALPSSCPDGYRCRQGPNRDYCSRNYPPCESDADCGPDGVCTVQEADDQLSLLGECRPPLAGGVLPGENCPQNRCRNDICHWTNSLCSELCGRDADCTIPYLGFPTACVLAWLVVTPGDCGRDAQCPVGYSCVNAHCRGPAGCGGDADCEPHYVCRAVDAGSPPTMACLPESFYDYLGECRIGCRGDPDCPSGMQCHPAVRWDGQAVQGYCRQPPSDPTTPTGAGPCGGAADPPCSHGICFFAGGSSYCTQLCGDAGDCPGVMNCTPGTLNMGDLGSFDNTFTCSH